MNLFYTFLYRYSANDWSVASAAVELGKAAAAAAIYAKCIPVCGVAGAGGKEVQKRGSAGGKCRIKTT